MEAPTDATEFSVLVGLLVCWAGLGRSVNYNVGFDIRLGIYQRPPAFLSSPNTCAGTNTLNISSVQQYSELWPARPLVEVDTFLEGEKEIMIVGVTGAEHDTDRLDQSRTVNGYDLVTIILFSVCSLHCQWNTAIRLGVLR